jgi:type VI secretion system protein ImpK
MPVSLRDLFTPLFSYVLLVTRPSAAERTVFELGSDIDTLLAAQEQAVKRHQIPAQDYDLARFAVVAWADEVIVGQTQNGNREAVHQWKKLPLQKRLYNTANAGEEFFEHLAKLTPAQKDVREIYYLCLCLGFRGRYYDESQEFKLAQLRRELGEHLPERVPDLLELERSAEKITPQPYAVQAPPPRRPPRSLALLWAALVSAALAALVLYAVSKFPQGRTPEEILADLNTRVRGFTCSEITVGYQDKAAMVTLGGHVESESQRQEVVQAVKGIPETIVEVHDTMTVLPRPFCAVLAMLGPLQARAKTAGLNLSVRLQNGCDAVYRAGENMRFTVSGDKPLAHVYLDYYVADRETVGHLYPGGGGDDTSVPSSTLSVGGPDSKTQWEVEPPFGMELITAISSPDPLFQTHPPGIEKATAYLDALHAVLPSDAESTQLAAAYCFITTESQ